MKDLKALHEERLFQSMIDGRDEIFEAFEELRNVIHEYSQRDEDLLLEIGVVNNLSGRQLKKLFQAVSAISKGQSLKGNRDQRHEELSQKMVDAVKGGFKKLKNANPIENFEKKAVDIIGKWKGKLDPSDKAIDAAKALGRFAKKNPAKSAFVLGVLGTLTSALGTPAFGAAASAAISTAMELAKKV